MAEELLTGQPTPPTGPLPLTYQNLFAESTKVSQRKDVPLPNGKYAANAKELETFLQTPENQDAFYKMYSAPAMAFGARDLESFKTKLGGGLTSGEIAMQKAKPSLPTVQPVTQVQQMEYQDLNQPAITQFNELKANKINKTATGKPLNTYTEMQDYFSKPENVSEWGKAYNYSLKTKGFDLNQIANNAKPVQSLKTVTDVQMDAAEQIQRDDLDQVDPEKLAELVYNAEELGLVGESIELEKPIEYTEIIDGQVVTKQIDKLTYEDYTQLLKKKYGKIDEATEFFQPSVAGEPTVFEVNEFEQAKGKVKENYLDIVATKQQDENRTKIKNYDADVETKMRQLLSPDDQKLAQITDQIESLTDQMLMDKYSGKGVAPDFQAKLNNLEQQAAQARKDMGLASDQMFNSVTGQMIETTPEEKQAIQVGAQKAKEKYSSQSPKDQLKAERNLLWEKVQVVDQQINSVKNEWENQQVPGSTAIGMAQQALGIEGGMTGRSAQLYNSMLNLQNKKAELYGQMQTLNKLLYTNEDVFKREKEYGVKAAAESVVEKGYGFSLFSDQNTIRTRVQEVEEAKKFFEERGIQLSNKQLLGAETGLGEAVGAGIGPTLNGIVDIGISSYGLGALTKGLTGSKYWQVAKEFMSNKYGAAGRFATSMTEGSLPYLIRGTAYEAAGQSFGTGVAETAAEKLFDKYAAQGLEKFGGKYGKLTFILGRWLSGATGEFTAEVVGNIAPLLAENGFDVNKAYEEAFGKTSDERTKNLAILGMSVTLLASPANLAFVFKTKQKIQEYIANNGSNPVLEETLRVIDDTIERMPAGEAATRLDERIYGNNPVEPLVFTEAPSTIINEDAIEPPTQGPVERPLETVEVEKRSANNGEEFFVLENDGKVNKNVVYRVNETNGQLEVKGYDAMQEGWVPATKTITDAVDRKSKENGIISSDKATRVAKQRLNIDPDADRVITAEGKVLYQTPGQTAAQFGRNRQRNTNTVRATADNTFAFLNGVKEKIISTVFPNAETKVDDQQSASYNTYRDAVRTKMKLNAGSFFSRGKAVLMESGMNKIPKVADFLAALVEDFSKTGKSIEITVDNIAQATTKTALKIEDVVNNIIATEFFQDKFGSMAEASDYAKNLLTDLMINDKSVAQEIFGQDKEAYNQFIKFREGFNKYVAKNYTGSTNFKTDHKFYNNQMPDMAIRAREEEFQMEEKQRVEEQAKREDVANVLNLAGIETSTQNVEGVRYKQGDLSAEQYLETLGEDTNGLTADEITAKADVAAEGVNIDTFNEAVANRTTNEQTRKKREARLRKELRTKFGLNNPLAKLIAKGALPDMKMRSKRAVAATIMNKVIETAATRAGVTADEFLDNFLQFQKSTEQEFMDFVKNQPGGKELYQRIGELGAQYKQEVVQFLDDAKRLEKQGKTPDEILMATGWSRGLSGDWKYSIVSPSSSIKIDSFVDLKEYDIKTMPLGSILNDQRLYAAYPQLKTLEIVFENNPTSNSSGSYNQDFITLNLANNSTLFELETTLQHEIQHVIQHIEGWQGGASENSVKIQSPNDVLESVAQSLEEIGEPVSQIALEQAKTLYKKYSSQIKGAKRNDFAQLLEIVQKNMWDAVHPKFNESLVDEFLKKFPTNISNEVIKLLEAATNESIYYSVYGEQEARRAEQTFKYVDLEAKQLINNPALLERIENIKDREKFRQYVMDYRTLQSEYEALKKTSIEAFSLIGNVDYLTQLQRDTLLNAFQDNNADMQNLPLNLLSLYQELNNTESVPRELVETLENVIKLRSDYAYKGAAIKNQIILSGKEIFYDLEDETSLISPLFWQVEPQTKERTLVPQKKYNPANFSRSKKQYDADKKQLVEASDAIQNFEPKTLFQENRGAAFITQDATDLIVALTDPNLSTPLHEIAHIYEKYMTDAEKKVVLDATGETSWSTNTSEYFARGFERYLYSGNAPSAKFLQIFDKLRTWLKEIYTELTGSEIDVQLNQPMRDLYAAMLGQVEAPETQVTAEEGPKTADKELADFIQSKKDQGIPEEQIYTGLLQSGFKAADLEDFFNLKTRQTVASQIEEEGPMKDEARIAADEASGMYIRRTAEQLEMEMDSLTAEEAFTIIEHISQGNADVAISVAIQNILAKKALGENVQKEFDQLIEVGTNLGRALQAFTRLKNQSGALRARNIINKIEVKDKKKLPAVIKQKLIELGDKYDQAKLNFNNAKEAATANPMGQSIISGKANIDYFQEKLKEFEKVGKEFSKLVAPYTSKTSITDTAMTIMRGNLLTPNSTVINITANTAKTIFNLPINLIGSLGSAISSKVGGTKGTMRGWDYYTGAWKYKLRGFKKAAEILKEGNVPDTSKGLQLDTNFNGFRSLYQIVGSIYAKIIDKKTDEEIAAEYGYSLNAMNQIPKKEMLIKTIEGTFGFPAEVFFRVLGAGDAVFRNTAYYSALTEQAKLAGLKDPKDIENFIILNSDYSNTKADNEALRFVYANNSRIYQGVSKIYGAGSDLPGKAWKLFATGVIPYAKIPTNVIIEFSEIMIPELSGSRAVYYAYELNKLAQKQKTTKNPQEKLRIEAEKQDLARKRDEMVGKAVVGTALTLTAATIAESGALSGGAQGEDRKRKDFQYRFERPYSINLSLLDRFINNGDSSGEWLPNDNIRDYRFMGILGGMLFAAEENRKEEVKSGKGKAVNQSVYSIIGDFFVGRANNLGSTLAYLIDQSFLRGAAQFFGTLNPTQEGSGERFVSGLLSTYSTVIIPNFMAIYDKANRNYIPEYDSPYELGDKIYFDFMAKVNERIPGNENVTPKIDAFGRPIPQTPVGRNPWLYNSIDVTKSSTGLYDDEDQRWEQLVYHAVKKGDILSAMPPHPSPYIKTLVGGEKYRMSQEEYEKYSIAIGEARRQIVNRFISTGNADKFIDLKSSLNSWPDGRPKTVDNEGHLMGYSMLGEILSSLYSAADATMINAERGIINDERKKMAIERPEEYQKLIEREKNNIYSNAINRLYDNPNVGKYLPKTTAMDIFFTKRVKYEPDNKAYQATGDETQQGQPVEQLTEEERLYREYIKQRDKK